MRRIGIAIGTIGLLWVFLRPAGDPPDPRRVAYVSVAPVSATPDAPPAEDPLRIEVMSVLATNRVDTIDPELRPLIRQLRFTRYSGFIFLEEQGDELLPGEGLDLTVEGRDLEIVLVGLEPGAARLRMKLWSPDGAKILDTTVAVHLGKCFMVAGPKVDDGVLVLPICARRP